jgi:hypothetical protein
MITDRIRAPRKSYLPQRPAVDRFALARLVGVSPNRIAALSPSDDQRLKALAQSAKVER